MSGFTGFVLAPPYLLFRSGVAVKNGLYDRRVKKPARIDARVVSVGGLSFGGAGKSPMTIYLAARAAEMSSEIGKTAVVSRGYHRYSRGFMLVSDGKKLMAGVQQAGDELYMIAKRVPQVVVIADENRIRGAKSAVEMFGVKNIILDDAFQRRSIGRNLDVVMVEPELALSKAGYFTREGFSSLRRAGTVVILDSQQEYREIILDNLRRFTEAELFFGRRKPFALYNLKNGKEVKPAALQSKRTSAFCGLANPGRLSETLNEMGLEVEKVLAFPDHRWYSERDLGKIARFFTDSGAEALITTEKDAVKLPPVLHSLPIYYLAIELEIEEGERLVELVFGT